MRLSAIPPKSCTFDLYRLNIQFRLFAFDNEGSDKGEVDSVALSTGSEDNKITAEDGKYTEDLEIKLTLNGNKLDSINADNLIARIIYRSSNLNPVQLKANGSIVKQNDSDDKAVTGGYEHSFEISNITVDSQMSGEAVLSFVLNLNGVSIEDFPTDFLVEFYSDTKDEKALPFIYTQTFSFETNEPEPEPAVAYSIKYDLNGGTLAEGVTNPDSYNEDSDTIVLNNPTKNGYEFTGWSGTDLTGNNNTTVTISKGSTGEREFTANYTITNYTITYKNSDGSDLTTTNPTTYNVETGDITLINPTKTGYEFIGWTYEGQTSPQTEVKIDKGSTGDKTFTAHFSKVVTLAIAADDGAVIDDVNNLYYTKATFNITPTLANGIVMTDTEKANILSALSVKDPDDNAVSSISKSWNNDGKIALSFLKDLTASTTFTISFGDVDDITITCQPKTFKTFYFKGKGTDDNRYQIESAEQLDYVRNYLDKHFVQTADIDLGAYTENWSSIGGSEEAPFIGSYYGNGNKIKNLTIHTSEPVAAGLFGYVGSNEKKCDIASITVDGVSIRDAVAKVPLNNDSSIGIIACLVYGDGTSIKNCVVTNSTGNNSEVMGHWVGGICFHINKKANNILIQNCKVENCDFKFSTAGEGVNIAGICFDGSSTIDSCHVENVNISCDNFSNATVCGICIGNPKDVKDCTVKNSKIICVTAAENSIIRVGGICSRMPLTLDGCSLSNSTIKAVSTKSCQVGGICSNQTGSENSLKNSYVENSILTASGTQGYIGGIAGNGNEGTIDNCYISGTKVYGEDLNDDSEYFYVGGIIGSSGQNNVIKRCHTTNSIVHGKGQYARIGGICGENDSSITSCYVTGSSSISSEGTGNATGGICGLSDSDIISCYVKDTNVSCVGNSGLIGGICGLGLSNIKLSACYLYESDDTYKITSSGNNNSLGYLVGGTSITVSDCFTNKTTNQPGDISFIGNGNAVTNCYGGITSSNIGDQTWSDGKAYTAADSVWKDYKTTENHPWPLDLKDNPRP